MRGTFLEMGVLLITTTDREMSEQPISALSGSHAMFLGFRKPSHSGTKTKGLCHSSKRPHFSQVHLMSFTWPSSTLVLQATNTGVRSLDNVPVLALQAKKYIR